MAKFYNLWKDYKINMSEIRNRTVYMLCRTDGGTGIYIGSTLQPLDERFKQHKQNAGNPSRLKWYGGSKLYKKMREVGVNRWKIVPLLTIPCDRAEICEYEQEWIKALNADLNMTAAVNGDAALREYYKQRHRNNKETKRFYCEICDVAYGSNYNLKKHFDTLKHSYAWLNSID